MILIFFIKEGIVTMKLFSDGRSSFLMTFDFQKKYDIAVAGAGVAGIAAALAAARRGHKVVLLEKQMLIGGLATSGLIYIYLPLCDGQGTQVTFGISEEMLRAGVEFSPFDFPENSIAGVSTTRFFCTSTDGYIP